MPNWCNGYIKIKGNPKDIENFCKLFAFDDIGGNEKEKCFARSFTFRNWKDFKAEHLGANEAEFNVDFAWSAWSCLFEGYPNGKECVTLEWACKKYKVNVEIETEELTLGFEEEIKANPKNVSYSSKDMPSYKCNCGNIQFFPSSCDFLEEECGECEKTGNWIID